MRPRNTRRRPSSQTAEREAFLDALERAPDLLSGVGRSRQERRMIADRLFDACCDCRDPMMAISYALRAVRLDPACLDARVFLAIAADGPASELIEELETIVAIGEADFGLDFFKQNRGEFWGLIETRPYMRARHNLAHELYKAGHIPEAIHHYEEMLRLNPDDNQGLRYSLLGHYLEVNDLDGARRLFQIYGDEPIAMFLWARVLECYLSGDLTATLEALQQARMQNPHVEPFLVGKTKLPKSRPNYYTPGDITEAMTCMDAIGSSWKKHREAIQWLKKEHGSGYIFKKGEGKSIQ
ncbi:MAG TPA: tetratricopeptide repeat protein [Candidatus Angelobacter sp.]|jgi:tetratricopeptide (TPR) repeat protein